jgi:hypothetical protein
MRLGSGAAWTDPTNEERPRFAEMARQADLGRLVEAVRLFSDVVSQRFTGWQPQLPLELAFVEAAMEQETVPSVGVTSSVKGPEPTTTKAAQTVRTTSSQQSAYQPSAAPQSVSERVKETKAATAPSATQASATAATATTATTAAAPSVEQIREQWRDILQQMRKAESLKSVAALLHGGQPMGFDAQGVLVIGFRHTFHRNKVNTDENRMAVERFFSSLFNRPFYVRCELEKEVQAGLSSTPPSKTSSKKKNNPEEATSPSKARAGVPPAEVQAESPPPPEPPVESWEEDELVERAKRELGAVPQVKD